MKLKIGRYHSQWSIGLSYVFFNNIYRAISLYLIFFYIELVITDYPNGDGEYNLQTKHEY